MSGRINVLLILALMLVSAGAGFWLGHHRGAADADKPVEATSTEPGAEKSEEDKPVATVVVAPVRQAELSETITAYGSVIADPSEMRVLSVPFESRVGRVLVTPGQEVSPDTELLQVQASPDTVMALHDAKNAFEAAQKDLKQLEQRFADHLATNQELSLGQQTFGSAKLKLESLIERGVENVQHLKAPTAGVVSKLDVQEGQVVPAGGALAEVAAENRIQVKLGLQPEDASRVKPGDAVRLRLLDSGSAEEMHGRIRVIGKRVDPATRLVDLLVELPKDTHLLLESFVIGLITRTSSQGLIVPRDAVLVEEDGGFAIYTIAENKAVKHAVQIVGENKQEAQIAGEGIKAGDKVAVLGNYVLEEGMEVKEEGARGKGRGASEEGAEEKKEVEPGAQGTSAGTTQATSASTTQGTSPATTQATSPAAGVLPPTLPVGGEAAK